MNYDGTRKLSEALAELCGCSPKNHNDIAALTKQAKDALGIASKIKKMPVDMKLAIYSWHYDRLNADKTVQEVLASEPIIDVPTPDGEPIADVVQVQEIPDTSTQQPGQPASNWGGVRPGAGRKATGKQSVTVRVPVELLPVIEEVKRTGLIPVTDNQNAALLTKVQQLEKGLQDSKYERKALSKAHAQLIGERDKELMALKAQPHQCQYLTQSGEQCGNRASHQIKLHGCMVHLCGTHYKNIE